MPRNIDGSVNTDVKTMTAAQGGESQSTPQVNMPIMANPEVEIPDIDVNEPITEKDAPQAKKITPEEYAKRVEAQAELKQNLASRNTQFGNPGATLADPIGAQVQPRYIIVQNRSDGILHVPDLRSNMPEDPGLIIQPGEVYNLGDFYTPMEINRSRGLRYAATKMKGVEGNRALVPLANEEEGGNFKVPEKKKYPAGTTMEDTADNPFDERFDELEKREAKREDKLLKKTLAGRKQRQHGSTGHV